MNIYVASSWRNSHQQSVIIECKKCGHKVYDFRHPKPNNNGFAWSDIDPDWEKWTTEEYIEALNHPIAIEGFGLDREAMNWANVCLLVLPSGRSAHVEAGWMQGAGKDVYVYSPEREEPELMYKLFNLIIPDMASLHNKLVSLR